MPLALVAIVGVVVVGFLLLQKPSSTARPNGTPVNPGNTSGLAGTVRQFTAGPLGGPNAPLNTSGQNARPSDAQVAQAGATAFGALPGLVTAIGTQENASTKLANDQQIALLKTQPQTNQTAPSAQQPSPVLRAPAGTEQTSNQFAASSGRVTQDVPPTPPGIYDAGGGLPANPTQQTVNGPLGSTDYSPAYDPFSDPAYGN